MKKFTRRNFVKVVGGTAAVSAVGAPVFSIASGTKKVVVIGGGTAGATAAKYIKRGDSSIDVTIIEPNKHYHTCYLSNEVLSGHRTMESIRFGYDGLKGHGINIVHDMVSGIDAGAKKVMTAGGQSFDYDRCIVAPGISLRYDTIGGYSEEAAQMMPHAWKAGEQTQILRDQVHAMKDGGTVIIAPPPNPFRCPPGPYERACQIGMYLKANKPKSKIVILDAKKKFSKMKLFMQAFDRHYKGIIEWHSVEETGGVASVDAKAGTITTGKGDTMKGDVVNIIPAQHAGSIAKTAGLTNDSGWCPVDHATFESTIHKGIHVIGDAAIQKPLPKSGYAASSEAKVTAAAVVNLLNGNQPGDPSWVNTCYSIVGPDDAISVAMVYNLVDGKVAKIKGSGGLTPMDSSATDRAREVQYAYSWFNNITSDIFM
ncbi:NAD(P)/FAD-dependent oxidoreductase [Solemya velum gill symbiont]|uniref:Cytochrome C n=1 Tax=Solemya velum gill symbiont TaxID=2340 RepID=A0A0B0HB47_SOVGS|nr:NAD(P)/FAD-dependent oxidoreductase [Solemya velum gill symbiont]KHF25109.1 flavocytochrome c dehydrogenase FccAB, subunit B [Solemya velum gill symbiont]OOY34837.1 cytochrome C [Solemya velum gill symbiont]OOY37552.1 cytochrome C [Solemya velum gill symbiont]OOY40174.1 cytochrome C [Solemya velum gill symbiont]OOY46887.1 cytochrome C [Solemya velum gill symbiont]